MTSETVKQDLPDESAQSETAPETGRPEPRFRLADYAMLLKPRVMRLVVFTAWVGMLLAPGSIGLETGLVAILCIAIGAGASGAINMYFDRDIDVHMARTANRPIPAGRMRPHEALGFGVVLGIGSVATMALWVNIASASLLAVTILYYVFIYTLWLKRRTPQNIVIGGAAGAFPPMIGWVAVTGGIDANAMALFAIIFLWTPPHSWALALFRKGDYENAGVPMMPVVAGVDETKRQIVLYTVVMIASTFAPVALGMSGWLYGVGAAALGAEFMRRSWKLRHEDGTASARPLFFYSIMYLFAIFVLLLADKALQGALQTLI